MTYPPQANRLLMIKGHLLRWQSLPRHPSQSRTDRWQTPQPAMAHYHKSCPKLIYRHSRNIHWWCWCKHTTRDIHSHIKSLEVPPIFQTKIMSTKDNWKSIYTSLYKENASTELDPMQWPQEIKLHPFRGQMGWGIRAAPKRNPLQTMHRQHVLWHHRKELPTTPTGSQPRIMAFKMDPSS